MTNHERKEAKRFTGFSYEKPLKRDNVNPGYLLAEGCSTGTLEESGNLTAPEVIAREIAEDLEAALEQFAPIAEDLKE